MKKQPKKKRSMRCPYCKSLATKKNGKKRYHQLVLSGTVKNKHNDINVTIVRGRLVKEEIKISIIAVDLRNR